MEEQEYEIPDVVEDFKVRSFIKMVKPFNNIALVLESTDPMEVEQWPLVQAFASEVPQISLDDLIS
jgi:hypothetical protein